MALNRAIHFGTSWGSGNNIALDSGFTTATPPYLTTSPVFGMSGTSTANVFFVIDFAANASGSGATFGTVADQFTGLTWTRHGPSRNFQSTAGGSFPWITLERWWAFGATGITAGNVTAVITGGTSVDGGAAIMYAFTGVNVSSLPTSAWDANASLQGTANGTATAPTIASISTTNTNTCLLMSAAATHTSGGIYSAQTAVSPFTNIVNAGMSYGTNDGELSMEYVIKSTSTSGLSAQMGTTWDGWLALIDALVSA